MRQMDLGAFRGSVVIPAVSGLGTSKFHKMNEWMIPSFMEDGETNDSFPYWRWWNKWFLPFEQMWNEMKCYCSCQISNYLLLDSKYSYYCHCTDWVELFRIKYWPLNLFLDRLNIFSICISMYYHRYVYTLLNRRVH